MTSLLHTADVHLRRYDGDRWDALAAVLDRAEDRSVDVVTIGGDLFDRPSDVETLRPRLRTELFANRPFEILLIPGNHDESAFRRDLFFGEPCTVVAGDDPTTWTSDEGDLSIVALPYRERLTDELAATLRDRTPQADIEALLFHGSLDAPIRAATGGEEMRRYFPITERELAVLGFDYYLAGHYHDPHHRQFGDGAEFVYPGTPISTTRAETGRRQVVRLEGDGQLSFEPLDTPHHLEHRVTVTPGEEAAAIDGIVDWLETAVTPSAEPRVIVDGAVDLPESAFRAELEDLVDTDRIDHRWVSVGAIADHPVLAEFAERLAERDWDDETQASVWVRTLRIAARRWA